MLDLICTPFNGTRSIARQTFKVGQVIKAGDVAGWPELTGWKVIKIGKGTTHRPVVLGFVGQ